MIGHCLLGVSVAWFIAWAVWTLVMSTKGGGPLFPLFYMLYAATPVSVPIVSVLGALMGALAGSSIRAKLPLAVIGFTLFPIVIWLLLLPYLAEYNHFVQRF